MHLDRLLCCYMPETLWDEATDTPTYPEATSQENPIHRQDVAKILWPSTKYVSAVASECGDSMMFMRQDILDGMAPDVQSQLHQYQSILSKPLVPHQKCYLRRISIERKNACTCTPLAWCLLSSACLSKGAQGELHRPSYCTSCGHDRQVSLGDSFSILTASRVM